MAETARAWIDGAARGNPGEAGFGVRLLLDGEEHEIVGFLGVTTNNVAEYAALVALLTYCQRRGVRDLEVRSDSQLLVRQVLGEYRVKAAHLVPIFLRVLQLKRQIPRFRIEHVRREGNKEADRLANRAVDERVPPPDWLELEPS
ncbi:MAG: ribonuclease HI family protein [Thermoanaerobaculia bacterium]|nr:ribonuclease HI family protein [Thermoanaerobaculia bacterium]